MEFLALVSVEGQSLEIEIFIILGPSLVSSGCKKSKCQKWNILHISLWQWLPSNQAV